jgi:hypothetical protein
MTNIENAWRPFEPSREAVEDARTQRRSLASALDRIRDALARYAFTPQNEADMQEQVASALVSAGMAPDREVIAERGRYDILVRSNYWRVVLELKVAGSAAAVERQAQRYALTDSVDAVVIVTTSSRLANELRRTDGDTLGGKPFAVIVLRAF